MSVAHKVVERDCFVPVHVAGLTPDFVNDELFGHVKGAFTGAQSVRDGQIQAAHGGTLLIDEVGDLSREAQLRLLRVLQDGQVARTGENSARTVSVRLLAATNRDLAAAVGDGSFRRDLLYRIGQGWLELPPLRARAGWSHHVVDQMLRRHGQMATPLLVRSARDALACHDWPGNHRELDNVLEIAVANARGTPVRVEHLPRYVQARYLQGPIAVRASGDLCDDLNTEAPDEDVLEQRLTGLRERIAQTAAATPNADLAGMLSFHEKIPDRSPEHARTLEQLRELKDAAFERDKLIEVHKVWVEVAQRGLPQAVARRVAGHIAHAATEVDGKTSAVAAIEQAIDIVKDPWWKLATDLAGLPIFDAAARPAVLQFIPFAMSVVASISQDVADQVAARVRKGGLAALRAAAAELMREANEPGLPARFDIENADRAQWLEWCEEFPKKRDFIAACGRDGKTVAKYAKMSCSGRDPWTRRPRRGQRARAR
jgi:DNA-binding NtrC family response regulator